MNCEISSGYQVSEAPHLHRAHMPAFTSSPVGVAARADIERIFSVSACAALKTALKNIAATKVTCDTKGIILTVYGLHELHVSMGGGVLLDQNIIKKLY